MGRGTGLGPELDALAQRYRGRVELGISPALFLVDFTAEFVRGEEMRADLSCHPEAAIERAGELVRAAREADVPVVWTRNTVEAPHGRESWTWTHGPDHRVHPHAGEITGFVVASDEFVVNKTKPSAFFSTPLLSFLIARQPSSSASQSARSGRTRWAMSWLQCGLPS